MHIENELARGLRAHPLLRDVRRNGRKPHVDRACALFKAMAHPARLSILGLLNERERNIAELEASLGIPQAAFTQQLTRLRRDGLVRVKRQGRRAVYQLADESAARFTTFMVGMFGGRPRAPNDDHVTYNRRKPWIISKDGC